MKKIYTYNSKRVIIENGKTIYSDTPYCELKKKPDLKFLKLAGWKLERNSKTVFIKPLYFK